MDNDIIVEMIEAMAKEKDSDGIPYFNKEILVKTYLNMSLKEYDDRRRMINGHEKL